MKSMFNFLRKKDNGEPPWDYYFLQNLDEKEYPKYLAKLFYINTGEKLPLKFDFKLKNWVLDKNKCKTFNQKIQWIKLYDATKLKSDCTDKIKVHDYIKEKIGSEYLKSVLQICNNFDEINFDKLPNSFVIKCNHGCKWQYIIKDKEAFLNNERLVIETRQQMTGWLEQNFCWWGGFEMQYKNIMPRILIENLLRERINEGSTGIEVYCFSGIPKLVLRIENEINKQTTLYDEKLNIIDDVLSIGDKRICIQKDDLINQSFDLSKKLSQNFIFVRIDWMIYQNQLYFEEMTFTPYSGFHRGLNKTYNKHLGKLINL